jgi:hypothetical protein
MQWSDGPHAGFSTTDANGTSRRPVIVGGDFGLETVNVEINSATPPRSSAGSSDAAHPP